MLVRIAIVAVISTQLFFPTLCAAAGAGDSARRAGVLASVRQHLSERPPQWPPAWQQEYIDSIGRALDPYQNEGDFAVRTEAFRKGFGAFWVGMDKEPCGRTTFESYAAQMQWFAEMLMSRPLPAREDKDTVERQFGELCEYAMRLLKGEFPFLADAPMEAARQASLQAYHAMIEAPLVPLFMTVFTAEQMTRIRKNWARLYERRRALWRDIRDGSTDLDHEGSPLALTEHPHYQFVKQCLDDLPGAIWPTIGTPPHYVLKALGALNKERENDRRQRQADLFRERKLEAQCSHRLEKLEQWSFIFAALLETPLSTREHLTLDPNQEPTPDTESSCGLKGGDAHDLDE